MLLDISCFIATLLLGGIYSSLLALASQELGGISFLALALAWQDLDVIYFQLKK